MVRVINVSNEGNTFELIPDGTNAIATVFDITEVPVRTGDNAGQPQWDITFKIQEPTKYAGREIRYQKIPLYNGGAKWLFQEFSEALGFPHTVVTQPDGSEQVQFEVPDNAASLLGKQVGVRIGVYTDNKNVERNRIKGYAAPGDVKLDDDAAPAKAASRSPWSK